MKINSTHFFAIPSTSYEGIGETSSENQPAEDSKEISTQLLTNMIVRTWRNLRKGAVERKEKEAQDQPAFGSNRV